MDFDKLDHGTRARYTYGKCRCKECTKANRDYQRQWQRESRELKKGDLRRMLASLVSYCSESLVLSEGQLSNILAADRIVVRTLVDEGLRSMALVGGDDQ